MAKMKIDKDDRAIKETSHSIGLISYYSLEGTFDFKEKRIRRFYQEVSDVKSKWGEGAITSQQLLRYCEKKKIDIYGWLKTIPNSQKLKLAKGNITPITLKMVDSAILALVMMEIAVLKEDFRFSNPMISKYLEDIKNYIDSYATKQPKGKECYLNDNMIVEWFKMELKLDVETGKKVS